jgi:hypothetical protein
MCIPGAVWLQSALKVPKCQADAIELRRTKNPALVNGALWAGLASLALGPIVTRDLKEEMGKMMDEPAPKKPKGGPK